MGSEESKLEHIQQLINSTKTHIFATSGLDAGKGAILGAFIGDAAGSTLEFQESVSEKEALRAMSLPGGGPLYVGPGQITDDSELALCLGLGLLDGEGKLDMHKIISRYGDWMNSEPFDVGETIGGALKSIKNSPDPKMVRLESLKKNKESQSNGSLMRITPLCVWTHNLSKKDLIKAVKEEVVLTHPHIFCQEVAVCYALAIQSLIKFPGNRDRAMHAVDEYLVKEGSKDVYKWFSNAKNGNLPQDCSTRNIGHVKIAFIYSFHYLSNPLMNYSKSIFEILKKGGDTDTNAAIVGGLIGALNGESNLDEMQKEKVLTWDPSKGGKNRPEFLIPGNPNCKLLDMAQRLYDIAPYNLFVLGGNTQNSAQPFLDKDCHLHGHKLSLGCVKCLQFVGCMNCNLKPEACSVGREHKLLPLDALCHKMDQLIKEKENVAQYNENSIIYDLLGPVNEDKWNKITKLFNTEQDILNNAKQDVVEYLDNKKIQINMEKSKLIEGIRKWKKEYSDRKEEKEILMGEIKRENAVTIQLQEHLSLSQIVGKMHTLKEKLDNYKDLDPAIEEKLLNEIQDNIQHNYQETLRNELEELINSKNRNQIKKLKETIDDEKNKVKELDDYYIQQNIQELPNVNLEGTKEALVPSSLYEIKLGLVQYGTMAFYENKLTKDIFTLKSQNYFQNMNVKEQLKEEFVNQMKCSYRNQGVVQPIALAFSDHHVGFLTKYDGITLNEFLNYPPGSNHTFQYLRAFRQLADGLQLIHARNLHHGNINLMNIVICNNIYKFTGFSASITCFDYKSYFKCLDPSFTEELTEEQLLYLSPQIQFTYRSQNFEGNPINFNFQQADIFSLGLSIYALMLIHGHQENGNTTTYLHEEAKLKDKEETYSQFLGLVEGKIGAHAPDFQAEEKFPRFKEILLGCLKLDPKDRPTADEIAQWLA